MKTIKEMETSDISRELNILFWNQLPLKTMLNYMQLKSQN